MLCSFFPQGACGSEVYQEEPQYNAAAEFSFAEVAAESGAEASAQLDTEAEAELDLEDELAAETEVDAEADEEADEEADAEEEEADAASLLEAEAETESGRRTMKPDGFIAFNGFYDAPQNTDVSITLFPKERAAANKRRTRTLHFQKGWTFRPPQTEMSTEKLVATVLGKEQKKLSINKETINSAGDLVAKSAESMKTLREGLAEFEEFYFQNGGANIPTHIIGGTPEPYVPSFVEAGAKAEAEAGAQNIPRANPDMVPIPSAVKEIIDRYYSSDKVMMYAPVPVTYVNKTTDNGGAASFNHSAGFWYPRVGPAAVSKADYLLTRAKDVPKMELGHRRLWLAQNTSNGAEVELHKLRIEANQPLLDAKTHGIVDADLKPKMIVDVVNGTQVVTFVTPSMR